MMGGARRDSASPAVQETGGVTTREMPSRESGADPEQQEVQTDPATVLAGEPTGSLKEQSVRGGATVFASQAVLQCLSIGSSMVLARLLAPSDARDEIRLLLALSVRRLVAIHRKGEVRDWQPTRRVLEFRIPSQSADQDNPIQRHLRFLLLNRTYALTLRVARSDAGSHPR